MHEEAEHLRSEIGDESDNSFGDAVDFKARARRKAERQTKNKFGGKQ
jgi:hypothetical protein